MEKKTWKIVGYLAIPHDVALDLMSRHKPNTDAKKSRTKYCSYTMDDNSLQHGES